MLRNMTQYLNRASTYVEEYATMWYLTPDAEQFDGIQAIVADLEEKLMGNPNTLWGFNDTYEVVAQEDSDIAGSFIMDLPTVPADEVWLVQGVGLYRTNISAKTGAVQVNIGASQFPTEGIDIPLAGEMYTNSHEITLKEGYCIRGIFKDSVIGETCILSAWGYKMAVP